MHFITNALSLDIALAWTMVGETTVLGDLYNSDENPKKIASNIWMTLSSYSFCHTDNISFRISNIEISNVPIFLRLYSSDYKVIWLDPSHNLN